jgi:penicillin-binding protein 1C
MVRYLTSTGASVLKSCLSIAILLCLTHGEVLGAPSFSAVKTSYRSSDAVLLDRYDQVIHELRVDSHSRKLEWVNLGDISPALVKAVIRSEDKRFYDHHGADWRALCAAAAENIFSRNKRGASTITMQLASLLEEKLKAKKGQRTIRQKWAQIQAAREIEKVWTKGQILEAYLNLVSFRGELKGVTAASLGIFDKMPSGLDEAEAAILASLIRSPNASPEKVGERAEMLAGSLGTTLQPGKIRQLAVARLSRPYLVRTQPNLAPHAARMLLRDGRRSVKSTLDGRIQRFAAETLKQAVSLLSSQNVRDGAVLVVENKTGDVLAYVGNVGSGSSAAYVDGIQARRQAGSTLKPFLYGLAIDRKIITAASLIEDSPLDIPTERGVYRPENYDKEFRGFVPARTALASSINIPAVRTLNLVGLDAFAGKLREFGFSGLKDPEYYGPSLALGTADITLWELVNAYRTLANKGVWSRLRMLPEEKPGVRLRALSREAAFIVSDILSDREARSATFSLESPLGTRFWAAAKTGTSKDMRDNWCVGYSDRYTVGVWIGNFSGDPMWNVSGVSGAAPTWLEIMNYLHHDSPSKPPVAPPGVKASPVTLAGAGTDARKLEWFIIGTEYDAGRPTVSIVQPKIVYPAPNTVIAIDPDIPDGSQRVFIEAVPDDASLQVWLDGKRIGQAPAVSWSPVYGKHRLSLVNKDGSTADQITFEVK